MGVLTGPAHGQSTRESGGGLIRPGAKEAHRARSVAFPSFGLKPPSMLLSSVPYLDWPALPDPFHAQVISVLHQLDATQWWTAERLRAHQFRQLTALLSHFNRSSGFFRPRLDAYKAKFGRRLDPESFRAIPLLTRDDIRSAGTGLFNADLPLAQGQWRESGSSGSSGPPVVVRKTEANEVFHAALCLRDHIWQERDFSQSFASIRRYEHGVAMGPEGRAEERWFGCMATGTSFSLNSAFTTISEQIDWLLRVRPGYVFSYASLLRGLALHCERAGITMPWIKGLVSFGEVLTPAQRDDCRRVFGVAPRDSYSASEVSVMAIECPDAPGLYHAQSESVLLEILDPRGEPCPPGVPGRVVVTDLHNLATPMIRYEIGDIAEWGEACVCGRGLPVLRRIVGRTLSLLRLPDGDTLIPDIERQDLHLIAPIREAQVIQRGFSEMEVRLATDRPLTDDELARVGRAISHGLHDRAFDFRFVIMDHIPRSQAGKFEAFRCEIP